MQSKVGRQAKTQVSKQSDLIIPAMACEKGKCRVGSSILGIIIEKLF